MYLSGHIKMNNESIIGRHMILIFHGLTSFSISLHNTKGNPLLSTQVLKFMGGKCDNKIMFFHGTWCIIILPISHNNSCILYLKPPRGSTNSMQQSFIPLKKKGNKKLYQYSNTANSKINSPFCCSTILTEQIQSINNQSCGKNFFFFIHIDILLLELQSHCSMFTI